jgi:hypothetical protein
MALNSYYAVYFLDRVFHYVNASEFEDFIIKLSDDIDRIKEGDRGFYRIEKD